MSKELNDYRDSLMSRLGTMSYNHLRLTAQIAAIKEQIKGLEDQIRETEAAVHACDCCATVLAKQDEPTNITPIK